MVKKKQQGPDYLDMVSGEAKADKKSYGHQQEEKLRSCVKVQQCDGIKRMTMREWKDEKERESKMGELKTGDTIKCFNYEDMHQMLERLKQQGYKADYLYEKDGKEGMWVVIK